MVKKRFIFCVLIGLLFTQTACSNGISIEHDERNPEIIISEKMKFENLRVLELDVNHNDNKKVLNVFGDELKDGIYAYNKKNKTYILINSNTRNYTDYSFKYDMKKKILTLSYTTTEGSITNEKTLFLIESKKKNQFEELKLVNNGNDDGFVGVFTN